jgi:tagatose 6-phosphate kinase
LILVAGLTPAWSRILLLDALRVGQVNRAREVQCCASGKVLNVGLALHHLGARSKTLALVGGRRQAAIECEFAQLGAVRRWVISKVPTRVSTTILDLTAGVATELVENARPVLPADLQEFRKAYSEEAPQADVIVLTGSLPAGTPSGFYRELIGMGSRRVLLDAQGDPLLAALECRPLIVKPNREELQLTLRQSLSCDADLHAAMRELADRGAQWVVVSQGKDVLWISSATKRYRALPPQVEVVNPIGSGDCLAAGIANALDRGYEMPGAVRYGLAAASESIRHVLPARLDPLRVSALAERIEVVAA